jgi:steroid delta-isomerase-like uncharacterized protein
MEDKKIRILKVILVTIAIYIFNSCQHQHPKEQLDPIIKKYVAYWNTGNFEGIEDVLHSEFELRTTPKFEPKIGIESFKKSIIKWRSVYPDFNIVLNEIIYDNDKAAAFWTIKATHLGEGNIPPRGKKIEVSGISIVHFEEGKIKDEWICSNNLFWLQQLGYKLLPPDIE